MRGAGARRARPAVLLVVPLLLLLVQAPAAGAAPTLTLKPSAVAAGAETTATGTDFDPGADIRLHLDDIAPATLLAEVTADRTGEFEKIVPIPNDTEPGDHVVVACEVTGRTSCAVQTRASLTVRPPPPSATTTTTPGSATITSAPPPTAPPVAGVVTTVAPPTGPGGVSGGPQPTKVVTTAGAEQTPTEDHDLFATGIEVTQGIQDRGNHMPLVPLRPTFARVYVASDEGQVTGVRGVLAGWVDGDFRGTQSALNQPLTAVKNGKERRLLESSLLFRIPTEWTQPGHGQLELTAFVYAGDLDYTFDNDPDVDNNFRSTTVKLLPVPTYLDIVFAPIHLHEGDHSLTPETTWWPDQHPEDMARILAGLERFVPVTAVNPFATVYQITPPGHVPIFGVLSPEFDIDEQAADEAGEAQEPNSELQVWKELDAVYGDAQWYGTIPVVGGFGLWNTDTEQSISIAGISNGVVAYGEMDPAPGSAPFEIGGSGIVAHEVGHNLGLGHYGCIEDAANPGSTIEELGGGLDPDFPTPYPNCRFAAPDTPQGYYGLDVQYDRLGLPEPSVVHNELDDAAANRAWPLMSYGADLYSDPFSYCEMLEALGATCNAYPVGEGGAPGPGGVQEGLGPIQLVAAPGARDTVLMVRGTASADGSSGRLLEVAVVDDVPPTTRDRSADRLADMRERAPQSPVTLVLRDPSGAELARYPLARIGPPVHGVASGSFSFVEWLDVPRGLAEVALEWKGGSAERVASATQPEVEIVRPSAGAIPAGDLTLEWRGQDRDGNELRYDVLSSADGGRSWRTVARHLGGTTLTVRTTQLAGGDRVRLRVRASDGFHTAQADTRDIAVPDSPPGVVLVMSPRNGATYAANGLVVLSARASDLEDGRVERFRWSSDRDGALGDGADIHTRDLSVGEHRITVQATDRGGNTAEASVRIVIDGTRTADVPDDDTLARAERILHERHDGDSDASRLWVLGAAAVVVVGTALVMARRRRGAR